ncbi:PH domain-containing protein [Kytococcus sp. Marseille-QA3725]
MTDRPDVDLDLVDRYLVAGERVVIAVRHHWITVAEPIASAVLGLALVIWVGIVVPDELVALADLLWWVWFVVLGRTLFLLWQWRRTWFVGTDRRLLLTYGVLVRRVAMMPLSKVTDMNYGRSLLGRILGYGTFTMESAGQKQALSEVDHVPDPDRHYRAMVAEIFKGPGGESPPMRDELPEDAPQWDDEVGDPQDWDDDWDAADEWDDHEARDDEGHGGHWDDHDVRDEIWDEESDDRRWS